MAAWSVDLALPPWNVLLSLSLPCSYGFGPRHLLLLRSTCKALRGNESTQQLFFRLLVSLGVHAEQGLSVQRLVTLCQTVWLERVFVHTSHTACLHAARLCGDRDSPCVIAGSHALHRMLLMRGDSELTWSPGDVDAFVSGCRTPWTAQDEQDHEEFVDRSRRAHVCGMSCAHGGMCRWAEPSPLSEHGKPINDCVETVVTCAMDFLSALYPGHYISREDRDGYVGWAKENPPEERPDCHGNYTRSEVLPVLRQRAPPEWHAALESQLPDQGGVINARPHQLGRIIEIKVEDKFAPTMLAYGDTSGWSPARSVNVIELVSERPYAPHEVTAGFDMLQCGVAVLPQDDHGLRFVHSEDTRRCVERRQMRFSRYVLGPLPHRSLNPHLEQMLPRSEALLRIVDGLLNRALKYAERGFLPISAADGTRAPADHRLR